MTKRKLFILNLKNIDIELQLGHPADVPARVFVSRLSAALQHCPARSAAHPQPPADRQAQEGYLREFSQKHNRDSFRQGIFSGYKIMTNYSTNDQFLSK